MTLMSEYHVIGKRLPRIDAKEKVRGQAHYTDDLKLPGMLCGMILRSPFAHARILKIDASRALKCRGQGGHHREDTIKVKYGVISRSPKFVDEYPLAVDRSGSSEMKWPQWRLQTRTPRWRPWTSSGRLRRASCVFDPDQA